LWLATSSANKRKKKELSDKAKEVEGEEFLNEVKRTGKEKRKIKVRI
jgi:hypothetical protein